MSSCEFFKKNAEFPEVVIGCDKKGDGGLFFFVPVAGGNAVRVPVCEEHAEFLCRHYGVEDPRR